MKLITAIIRPEQLTRVLEALFHREVRGLTISQARGHGGEIEHVETYRGTTVKMELVEKVRLEIGVSDQSRNARIQPGSAGYPDASLTARILEIPQGQITRAMGDVHPLGNPHYWLDPGNGRRVAQAIQARLSQLSPADAGYFAARYADFDRRLAAGEARWQAAMAPYTGLKVVTYHRSWPNFCERFGLDVVGYVEPRPGIPPSPSHVIALVQEMKRLGIKIVLVEPYFDLRTPRSVARETGARIVVMPPSVGGEKAITDYVALFDHNVKLLVDAIVETGAR